MPSRSRTWQPDVHDIAAEIMRRATNGDEGGSYVVRLSKPPTLHERLRLTAARLQGTPIAIMPHRCRTVHEWRERYGWLKGH